MPSESSIRMNHPTGHFYSPVVNPADPKLLCAALAHPQGHAFAGGSFWIERV